MVKISPAPGVSLYVGIGHAPFGPQHEIEIPPDHAAQLGDRVRHVAAPVAPASALAADEAHPAAAA